MNARHEWKRIQQVLGTAEDGIPGPKDEEAMTRLRLHARLDTSRWEPHPSTLDNHPELFAEWHTGKGSSFADPADVRAFKRCIAAGGSEEECFKVGDNGIGKWGTDTTGPTPMVALPPEDWQHLAHPAGTGVIVELLNGPVVRAELQDTMPHKANITNGAIIDMNLACCEVLGLTPPVMADVRWRWA